MSAAATAQPWRVDGRFFRAGTTRIWPRVVTYGPFPGGWPATMDDDFRRIAAAGFEAVRLFDAPPPELLDSAWCHGVRVFGGLKWGQNADFFRDGALYRQACTQLRDWLSKQAGHPALVGIYVANEIPSDLVRWMGPLRVRLALERLIDEGRAVAPGLMFAYANYPSTEYLEPANADFTGFNIYLEDPECFRAYLRRLQQIAGDRPLMIAEFGIDSRRHGLQGQREVLEWGLRIAREEETAGFTIYAWSDRWWNAGAEVLDWDFGLTDRAGRDKHDLGRLLETPAPAPAASRMFSVIICTRNGRGRIEACLRAVRRLAGVRYETIVVDDGSGDGTADWVADGFADVRVVQLEACGLGAARNAGAAAAQGEILAFTDDDCEPDPEWLLRMSRAFRDPRVAAAGGPNLPPEPRGWQEAVVIAAPGAPTHVMLDDHNAEHLPGCNLVVTRAAFQAVGGFDRDFLTAGDDVDFCWRLRDAGLRLAFVPGAFVWHRRRAGLLGYIRQQAGYGRAERVLMAKHRGRFSAAGGIRWQGFIYGGGTMRVTAGSIIYYGCMGTAGYQSLLNPRPSWPALHPRFDSWYARLVLALAARWVPRLRAWMRLRGVRLPRQTPAEPPAAAPVLLGPATSEWVAPGPREAALAVILANHWRAGGPTDPWDAEYHDVRVLLATEHGEDGGKHTLVRVWGDAAVLPDVLRREMVALAGVVDQANCRGDFTRRT